MISLLRLQSNFEIVFESVGRNVSWPVVPEPPRKRLHGAVLNAPYNRTRRRRRALLTTDTELKLMAAAAIMGLSNRPNTG